MNEQKWVRDSLRQLRVKLGGQVSHPTIGRLLRAMGYGLKGNRKQLTGARHPDRDTQFQHLEQQIERFRQAGWPIISVDTKKKELIGNFKNAGQRWCLAAEVVNAHDFEHEALGKAVPYGIYDLQHNRGTVYIGQSADTSQFAVDAIATWWNTIGQQLFPDAPHLLILADAGGSNGCRPRLWKQQLQELLADAFNLEVTVCHYPTGASKWNPVEHRLFGPISVNWAGVPLRTFETMLALIRGTSTTTGLQVDALLIDKVYHKGIKVADDAMALLNLQRHSVCPNWNYALRPRPFDPRST
jgi:Rhodopirellula transposase DDE domain